MIVHGASYNIELNTLTGNKGHALEAFAAKNGIGPDEVMAFGDSENDLTMLKAAGTGVAMGNALPEVKAAADIVTLSNDEDGVAALIEKYVPGGE
jgi:hydroxymethylpyrimidine pyrophosphatase-like HAD family hydrolase